MIIIGINHRERTDGTHIEPLHTAGLRPFKRACRPTLPFPNVFARLEVGVRRVSHARGGPNRLEDLGPLQALPNV